MADLTIGLAGNPNAGKSTIFNALTGLRQHTGNWPGKTVEKKTGRREFGDLAIEFVDLPGTYSLAAYSPDEIVARDFIVGEHPDAVICVVDATNLERNLYLVVQVLELGVPVVVALNMADQARSNGVAIDTARLSQLLAGAPIVPTVAKRGEGIEQLLATTVKLVREQRPQVAVESAGGGQVRGAPQSNCRCQIDERHAFQVEYDQRIESAIGDLSASLESSQVPLNGYCTRWLSLKLLEGETDIVEEVAGMPGGSTVVDTAATQVADLESFYQDELDMVTADQRYTTVSAISRQVVSHSSSGRITLSERIDRIVTNRLIGLPIFLAVMYVVFRLVIDVSAPYLDWIDGVVNGPIAAGLSSFLLWLNVPDWFHSLVIDGVVAGVGGILTFVPGLIALFFFLAVLEDSGYLARAAFVMDRFMQFIGLHGKSVIPLMLGFGCAVPAVYATRTIANRRNRLLTALLIPFMSCSARLPVYVVFAMAFFGAQASTVIWLMYVLGIAVAILVGFIFSRTVLKPDESSAFVMELPPYRMPTLKGLGLHTWENTREFIRNAGTVILAISIVMWLLLNLPWGVEKQEQSLYGQFSTTVAPVLEPTGFGSYENAGALLTGLIAKELVVSTLSQVYGSVTAEAEMAPGTIGAELRAIVVGFFQATVDAFRALISLIPGINLAGDDGQVEDTALSQALQDHFTALTALAFLVFVLLYVPCIATMGAIKQEFGGRWAASAAIYQTSFAWLAAVLVFQGGRLLGFG
ncbi:MAG: ferrous iron transport protein B [Chloroflexota bacterium]|nr:MAG: ferrous iron transport protein B [Chloroflexota bacterium]